MATRKPAKKITARKAQPDYVLSITDMQSLAVLYRHADTKTPDGLIIAVGHFAAWADQRGIIPGAKGMNIPALIDAISNALPLVLSANGPQLSALDQARESFDRMSASLKQAIKQ